MPNPAVIYITPDEYLAVEADATNKHEYYSGQVISMAGAGWNHNLIVANLLREIGTHLKGKDSTILPSDMRVCTPFSDSYMYPDLSIVCGEPQLQDNSFDTLTNPSVIIEVMSPSTEDIDMGRKLFRYLQIPSLQEYILISSTSYAIKSVIVQPDRSFKVEKTEQFEDVLEIQTIGLKFPKKDVYYRVVF
jgi:Uma2 family endonuclease